MYETIKNYISRYHWIGYLIMAGIACAICWIIYGGDNDFEYQRATEHLERAQDEQRKSLELNQTVTDSVERVERLNQQASERIVRAQEYQQRASDRIEEGTSRIDEAAAILERNEQLIERVEQGYQAQSPNGTETAQTAQHVGTN